MRLGSQHNVQWHAGDRLVLEKVSLLLLFGVHLVGGTRGLRRYPLPVSWGTGQSVRMLDL